MRAFVSLAVLVLLGGCTAVTALAACGAGAGDAAAVAAVRAAVTAECECAGAPSRGAYLRCAAAVADRAVDAGTLARHCRRAILRCAARSTCGRPGAVACCRTTLSGRPLCSVCSVRPRADLCVAPARVADAPSCCDACPPRPPLCPAFGRSCSDDTECPVDYECLAGECRGRSCRGRPDCAGGGDCVFTGGATEGVCVCGGCRGLGCPVGCSDAAFSPGCVCVSRDDCPTENDVCFRGRCS